MKRIFYSICTVLFLFLQMNVYGQYILVVGSSTDDQSVLDILIEDGYTVVRGLDYSGELAAEKLDSVNNADLVIFSRNGSTAGHGEAEAVMQQWADVEAPILSLSPWIMRNNRWRWINSQALSCHGSDSISIPAAEQNHPIFSHVDVSSGFLEVIQAGKTRNEKFVIDDAGTAVDAGNGIILAQDPTDDGIMAAEWFEGDYFYNGGEILAPIAGSNRLWLGFITEGDNCQLEGNLMSAFNGTEDAKTIFLDAVAYMMGGTPESVYTMNTGSLKAFPNPVTDRIRLGGVTQQIEYQIVDMAGAIILTGTTDGAVDISNLNAGMYILRTNDNRSVKFVKQ